MSHEPRNLASKRIRVGTHSIYLAGLLDGLFGETKISMSTKNKSENNAWTNEWLEGVAKGTNTMSQRMVSSIEKRGGGLTTVKREASKRGIHLVRLEDDKGNDLVAASLKPFKVIT